jgi:glycosyltransferase involved in cell wall biosynthesis
MAKIIFDHQIFSYQRYGGASRYFAELIRHLPLGSWETTTLFSNNEYVRNTDLFHSYSFLKNKWFRGQGRIMNELNKPYSYFRLKKGGYDVFHQTHFETYCLNAIGRKPMVTTFHDTNFSNYNQDDSMVKIQKKSLARADKIIAISENTKKDLIEIFKIPWEKVEIIHHGVDKTKKDIPYDRINDKPYLLFVGARVEYKNFKRFIESFSFLSQKYPDLQVICTRNKFSNEELAFFYELKVADKVKYISADEITLAQLYRDAELFVFPSVYEGFGMPILEAMVQKCPIVLAKASCFPEIALDAAGYFDPYDVDDMYNAIDQILDKESVRTELILKGQRRLDFFSWEKTAQEHMNLYNSLI